MIDASKPLSLLERLHLSPVGGGRFVAPECPSSQALLYGGGLLATSLLAANTTVPPGLTPVAVHGVFLKAGTPNAPVDLEVESLRDSRIASSCRVIASQSVGRIFAATYRFARTTESESWQVPMTSVPLGPDRGRSEDVAASELAIMSDFELRAAVAAPPRRPVLHPFWVRYRGQLPDDFAVHAALLLFLTDIGVSGSAAAPGVRWSRRRAAVSMDHCLWWHRRCRVDQWLLITVSPLTNAGGRGLARGEVWTETGEMVASFAQEVLLRAPAPAS